MVERTLEVDVIAEVEEQKEHLVEDPADDEAHGDGDHRLEYALAGAFFQAPTVIRGVGLSSRGDVQTSRRG